MKFGQTYIYIGDGIYVYNWGNCVEFNREHPFCLIDVVPMNIVDVPIVLGDEKYDGGLYNNEAYGYEYGDRDLWLNSVEDIFQCHWW